jgi:hypothetical protein
LRHLPLKSTDGAGAPATDLIVEKYLSIPTPLE